MEPVPVFCHACDFLFAMSHSDSERSPTCEFCGSDFVEVLSDSAIPEPSSEASPHHGRSPRGVSSPILEDPFVVGPAEYGFPFDFDPRFHDPAEMFGAADEALMFLTPMVHPPNRVGEGQRNGRRGSLGPVMDQLTRMLQPSRTPTCASALHSLRRSNVAPDDSDLLRECCVVCHEQYRENERVVMLPCEHVFHEDCVMQWLNDHNTCPVCRFQLPTRTNQPPPNITNRRSSEASERAQPARGRRLNFAHIFGPTLFGGASNEVDESARGIAGRTRSRRISPPIQNRRSFSSPTNRRERDQNPRRRAYQFQQDARGPAFPRWDTAAGHHPYQQQQQQRRNDGVGERSNQRQRRDRNLSDRRVLR